MSHQPHQSHDDRQELGRFLRDRRGRIDPLEAGLPASGRRRTPGLRREEVAQLAGVGVTWYTWLEQGRKINASEQVLNAISVALRLDPDEHRHVLTLAGMHRDVTPAGCQKITVPHEDILAELLPYPCVIQNSKYDLLAWNRTYRFLIADVEQFPEVRSNCLLAAFTEPEWQRAYGPAFGEVAQSMVARFRAHAAGRLSEPSWAELLSRLTSRSPLFESLWEDQQVRRTDTGVKVFENPLVGVLRLHFTTAWIDQQSHIRMVITTPDDDLTAERLTLLDKQLRAEPEVSRRELSQAA
ncbi:helix-turn-helix transcriptional regulator [Acaricomes phytoseiuli]|uniref:helix-turn-helix transcriptional regulator n=1 Tax=Acaricomes phytoseiuli TaxID=291968 RepID=UPI0022221499|nr:helix-turn-helix transcriptional regulator [Acaricomes phytoseiuli]MCW1249433.1 helix-turn-helix transcriptional regulator [Acaricomes phytoseiuli]